MLGLIKSRMAHYYNLLCAIYCKIVVEVVIVMVHVVVCHYDYFFLFLVGYFLSFKGGFPSLCLLLNIIAVLDIEGFW